MNAKQIGKNFLLPEQNGNLLCFIQHFFWFLIGYIFYYKRHLLEYKISFKFFITLIILGFLSHTTHVFLVFVYNFNGYSLNFISTLTTLIWIIVLIGTSNQYLNRSILQANIINQIKESIIIGFGLSYNFRGLSNIDSFTSNKWGSIYSNISLKHFIIRGGLSSINNKYNPFFNLLFHLGNKNKGLSIKINKEIKPINELIKINDLNSESETTNSIVMNAWYSFSNLTIKSNLYSQNVFQNDNNKIKIQGFDLNLIINIFDNWILSGNMRHLSNPNNFTDGVGNILEFKLLANENLFKNNMAILFDLGLTGWINRKSNISFNPYYCRPILVNDSNFILNDQWSLNSTISIQVSSLKVSWKLNNVLSVLQSSIDSINDEQTMIINNYLLHQNNRNMGRLMQIHIDWYFLD